MDIITIHKAQFNKEAIKDIKSKADFANMFPSIDADFYYPLVRKALKRKK